jgi:surface antigen
MRDCSLGVPFYRLVVNKGNKAIKRFLSKKHREIKEKMEGRKTIKDGTTDFYQTVVGFLSRIEKKIIAIIKRNKTKVLLDFFRKNSAVLVVVLVSFLVIAGNINIEKDHNSFLFDYFSDPTDNMDKIQHRVKSQTHQINLTMAPLVLADSTDQEDISDLIIKDGNLNQNQMQHQVLTASAAPDAKKLLSDGADVAVYEVQSGDTVGTIAEDFDVTTNTILWANNIDDPDMIKPGDKIFILPITGLKHIVKSGDSIKDIAKEYEADEKRIIAFNELPADGTLKIGEEIIIPGGEKDEPVPVIQQRDYYSSDVTGDSSRGPSVIDRNPKGGHAFPYGYCTWYVATKKYVPWGGNAGTWLYNAKAYGAKTGKKPKKGAILVTNESWYGHVAIVEKVKGNSITVSEMNYKGFGVKSTRTLSTKSSVIKGYIY